jgi:hypothetical protein
MNAKPEDLLIEAWIPTYKAQIGVLHNHLARIRSTIFILEYVARFPFDLFNEHPGPFWKLVRESLETTVVVGLWRILFDIDKKSLTLRRLRNQVISNALDESSLLIKTELRTRDVNTRIRHIESKVCNLRHKHFAHLDAASILNSNVNAGHSTVTFEELRELATTAHDLINTISMGTYYMTLFPDYDPTITIGGQPIKPDVELLFDDMVARSEDLRLPEALPYEFPFYWKNKTPMQRTAFNEYRKKFGFPEVATDD